MLACLKIKTKDNKETFSKLNMILLVGEITTNVNIDLEKIVRDKIKEIRYHDEKKGLNYNKMI